MNRSTEPSHGRLPNGTSLPIQRSKTLMHFKNSEMKAIVVIKFFQYFSKQYTRRAASRERPGEFTSAPSETPWEAGCQHTGPHVAAGPTVWCSRTRGPSSLHFPLVHLLGFPLNREKSCSLPSTGATAPLAKGGHP